MKLKIEFQEIRNPSFAFLLRVCQKLPNYRVIEEGGIRVHVVEFTDKEIAAAIAIAEKTTGWKAVAYYVEGELMDRASFFRTVITKNRKLFQALQKAQGDLNKRVSLANVEPFDFLRRLVSFGILDQPN